MKVKLITVTPDIEKTIAYIARVSSPNRDNPEITKLLKYCIKHGHWSPFEMGNMVIEVETSRDIAMQILRHRSMSFQQFSSRYSENLSFELYEARRQDIKNRQNSIDDLSMETKNWFTDAQLEVQRIATEKYKKALELGIAKECARTLLPGAARTLLVINGSIRSWIHYIQLRSNEDTQKEHRVIAEHCKTVFKQQLPIISEALDWK